MKILTWNVNGRVQAAARRQLDAVLEREPDVIALQELRRNSLAIWADGLGERGYTVVSSVDLLDVPYPPPEEVPDEWFHRHAPRSQIHRSYFNLIAARHPLESLPGLAFADEREGSFAFPEKYVAARVTLDGRVIEIHNAHVPPGSSRGLMKVHAFEAVARRAAQDAHNPRILCGDFNAPWEEADEGPDVEVGHRAPGPKWPADLQRRWIDAETSIVSNPDLRDVYRDTHLPGDAFPVSHFTGQKTRVRRRYDYIFASRDFRVESCEYLEDWLERLSDHAAVEAMLAIS